MAGIINILSIAGYLLDSFTVVYGIIIIFVVIIIVLENRSPLKTIAWILVLILIPILGFILYLFFGQNYRKQKMFSRKGLGDLKWLELMSEDQKQKLAKEEILSEMELSKYKHIMTLLLNNSKALISTHNKVNILHNGDHTFNEIFEAVKNAKYHVHFEYYIIEEGELTTRLFALLKDKAKEGVEVRIIYDGVGSMKLSRKSIKDLKEAGIKLYCFLPVTFPYLTHKANYRNHRKIIVVDGKVSFVGGLNFADRYKYGVKELGIWRDTHLRIEGEGASLLQIVFLIDWYFVSQELLLQKTHYIPAHYVEDKCLLQIASSGADSDWATIQQAYFSAISGARKYVYISTPYFMPGPSMLMALKTASMSGVDVKILIPSRSDSFFSLWCSMSYVQELLDAGIKVYLYKKGFNHSKIMMIDDSVSTVGTANMDNRSFEQNFEVNAILYNEELTKELVEYFNKDIEDSEELNTIDWMTRSKTRKILESFTRLFSPLL